jgi:hypothetical protein
MPKPVKPRLPGAAAWASTARALFQFAGCESKAQSDMPPAWAMDFKGKTLGEIRSTIGIPLSHPPRSNLRTGLKAPTDTDAEGHLPGKLCGCGAAHRGLVLDL